jgi:hypothetical protein
MMINWHNGRQWMTIEETLQPLGGAPNYPEGTTYVKLYKQGRGLVAADFTNLGYAAGMKYPPAPISFTPGQLVDLMMRRRSPLMILVYWPNTLNMTHFRVVTRIFTDPDNDVDMVSFNDPSTGRKTGFFLDLIRVMEAAADKFPTAQVFYW